MRLFVIVLLGVLSLQVFGSQGELKAHKSPELIPWWSVNSGGNVYSGSGSYRLSSSVGQSVAGRAEGINHTVWVGFWNQGIIFVGVDEQPMTQAPRVHSISQNYPNPFNRTTTLCYAIPKSEPVKIEIFNATGQSVRVLVDRQETPGYRSVSWDGRDESGTNLGCGVYFYRITSPEFQATRKMLLLR